MNQSETAWTTSPKSQLLGFEPFLEGLWGPPTDNFEKVETRVQIFIYSPKKLIMAKFEQTSDQGLWPDYVTKITLFGFLAIFRGLVWASDRKFWKNSPNMQGYFSRVPKNTDRGKFEQNSDWGACPNYVTKMLKKCIFQPLMTREMAKYHFSSQNDFRYMNSPSKWTYKTKIIEGFVRRTDGQTDISGI